MHRGSVAFVLIAVISALLSPAARSAPAIDDFVREADMRSVVLSPDGKHLAMILNDGDLRTVVVRNLESPDMPVVGAFADDVLRPSRVYWANNDRILVSLDVPWDINQVRRQKKKDRGSFDIKGYLTVSRMLSMDRDMSNMALLMQSEPGLKRNTSLSRVTNFLPEHDDYVLMSAYRNNKRVLYKVNIKTGVADMVAKGSRDTFGFLSDSDGNPLYRFDYRESAERLEIFRYTNDDDWERIDRISFNQDDEDSIESIGMVALNAGDLVYRKRNEQTGFYELIQIDRTTRESSVLVALENQDVIGVLIDSRNEQFVGYQVESDFVRNVYFDSEIQAIYDSIAERVEKYNFSTSPLTRMGRTALVRTWGADDPSSWFLWEVESQEFVFVGNAYDGVAAENLSLPGMATFNTRDGVPLRAYILMPRDFESGRRYPTIVLPHGGPHSRSRTDYSAFAQFLSTRGYVVVEPNFRGSVGYGRDFEAAGYREWGGLMQDDLTDTVAFIVGEGIADPDRICIVGGSYGGYAALMGAVKTPDLFRCAISLNGVTHMVKQIEHFMKNRVEKDDWDELIFRRIGHPEIDKEWLDSNSPALHADRITIPVMIVAGTEDETVPFSQAKLMVKALKKARVEYEFVQLTDTGHDPFYYREDVERVFAAVEKFLKTHLE